MHHVRRRHVDDIDVGVIDDGIWPEHPSFADDGSYAVIVEVNSETDFVAKDASFTAFAESVAAAAAAAGASDVADLEPGQFGPAGLMPVIR